MGVEGAAPLRATVIGLGRVGSRFDEEPARSAVWTHVGAYLDCRPAIELVAACEIDRTNAEAFHARCPDVPIFADIKEMVRETRPDIISICTPAGTHRAVAEAIFDILPPRYLWCEKPLATSIADAQWIVRACNDAMTGLLVSYLRRWTPLWQRVRELIDKNSVGKVHCVRVAMANRLWSVGSHAVDLALMLGGPPRSVCSIDIAALEEESEPARAAMLSLDSGAYAIIQVTGRKNGLIVEAEVLGDEGRIRAREDTGQVFYESFVASKHYSGYRVLEPALTEIRPTLANFSPFVALAKMIVAIDRGEEAASRCNGGDALMVQQVLECMAHDVSPAAIIEAAATAL